jgi:pimeloyl-ACP methyl ester carboxylesterase
VWGDKEPLANVAAARRAAAHARAHVETIPDAWHHPWLADPARAGQLVASFLA